MATSDNLKDIKNILNGAPGFKHRYIPNYTSLASTVRTLKGAGYKIVLTQGVYDLFHVGHKRYLEYAKSHGDVLIVGVDTDELTRKRKGPKRPFDTLQDRVEILSSLKPVDFITVRNENDHMYRLIKLVRPDTLVMSQTTADFSEKDRRNLLQYCGQIKVVPAQAATTTTAKLRRLMIDGAEQLGQKINLVINEFLNGRAHENSASVSAGRAQRPSAVLAKSSAGRTIRSRK